MCVWGRGGLFGYKHNLGLTTAVDCFLFGNKQLLTYTTVNSGLAPFQLAMKDKKREHDE